MSKTLISSLIREDPTNKSAGKKGARERKEKAECIASHLYQTWTTCEIICHQNHYPHVGKCYLKPIHHRCSLYISVLPTRRNRCLCRLRGKLQTWKRGSATSPFLSNGRLCSWSRGPTKTTELKNSPISSPPCNTPDIWQKLIVLAEFVRRPLWFVQMSMSQAEFWDHGNIAPYHMNLSRLHIHLLQASVPHQRCSQVAILSNAKNLSVPSALKFLFPPVLKNYQQRKYWKCTSQDSCTTF